MPQKVFDYPEQFVSKAELELIAQRQSEAQKYNSEKFKTMDKQLEELSAIHESLAEITLISKDLCSWRKESEKTSQELGKNIARMGAVLDTLTSKVSATAELENRITKQQLAIQEVQIETTRQQKELTKLQLDLETHKERGRVTFSDIFKKIMWIILGIIVANAF